MIRPISWISLVILVGGLVVGAWRSWSPKNFNVDESAVNSGATTAVLLASKGKSIWIQHQVIEFNSRHQKEQVAVRFVEDRDAMTGILYGRQKPELWCPDSPLWVDRLNDLWIRGRGKPLVDETGPSFRLLMRTPLVFLTTVDKAAYLRPLLGSTSAWNDVEEIATGRKSTPWVGLRMGIANPLSSNSGMLALAMAATEYASRRGDPEPTAALVGSPGFQQCLNDIERCARVYPGTFELTSAYEANPAIADVIVTPESDALDAVRHNRRLAVIYPSPALDADNAICVLDGRWSSARQIGVANDFVEFLERPDALKDLAGYDMRPPHGLDESAIDGALDGFRDNGLRETYTTGTLPSYAALNALAYQWKHAPNHSG